MKAQKKQKVFGPFFISPKMSCVARGRAENGKKKKKKPQRKTPQALAVPERIQVCTNYLIH